VKRIRQTAVAGAVLGLAAGLAAFFGPFFTSESVMGVVERVRRALPFRRRPPDG
jgi:hypothetical protein